MALVKKKVSGKGVVKVGVTKEVQDNRVRHLEEYRHELFDRASTCASMFDMLMNDHNLTEALSCSDRPADKALYKKITRISMLMGNLYQEIGNFKPHLASVERVLFCEGYD